MRGESRWKSLRGENKFDVSKVRGLRDVAYMEMVRKSRSRFNK